MNKIYKFMLVFAAAAFMFAACEKPEPTPEPNKPNKPNTEEPTDKPVTPAGPDWCTSLFEVNFTIDETAGYGFDTFNYDQLTNAEGKTIHEYLGYETWADLAAAIGTIQEAVAFDRDVQLFGIDLGSESDIIDSYNTNGFGYWVDANGVKDAWGTETVRCYTESYADDNGYISAECGVGVMPGNTAEGDTYKFGMVFQKTGDEVLRAGVQITIKVEAFQDPDVGKYPTTATVGTIDVDCTATLTLSENEYDYDGPDFSEKFEAVLNHLGKTRYEFNNTAAEGAVYGDDEALYSGIAFEYILPDGTTGAGRNLWLNADNAVTAWGKEDAAVCLEWYFDALSIGGSACAMPQYYSEENPAPEGANTWYYGDAVKAAVGKTIKATFRITYIPADENGVATQAASVVNLNYAVTVAE